MISGISHGSVQIWESVNHPADTPKVGKNIQRGNPPKGRLPRLIWGKQIPGSEYPDQEQDRQC